MKLNANDRLVMNGDSITDCGRCRPVGKRNELGNGYVSMVDALLLARYPELGIEILNTGVSGNTIRHVAERWQTDVIDLKPDWLSLMIGINDVWRQFDAADRPEAGVLPDEYVETYDRLIGGVRPSLKGLILVTPYLIEPDIEDPMRARMDQYTAVVKTMAEKYDAILVDAQVAFNAALEQLPSSALAGDRVHPGKGGHMIIARAFLRAIGFEW